ncbi:MAG: phage tail protein [Pseudomonadota bacterium]
MIKIDIRHNIREQAAQLAKLGRELQDKAVAMALNKTADKGKTEMTRAITSEFNIKASDVRPQLNVRKASAKGINLVALLQAFASKRKGRSLNLIRFLERKVTLAEARRREKRGTLNQLGFQIKKRGGVKQIKGAFIGNKGRTVFIREGKERTPIKSLQTIDVPQMFNTRRINERVVRRIQKEFPVEFARAVQLLLNRR